MNARLVFIFTDSSTTESYKPLSFTFRKSSYLPYTQMKARAVIGTTELMSVSEVKLFVNDKLVHYGLIDTLSVSKVNGDSIVNVTSRSFTSLLCQNQIEPGMKMGVSINDLMDSFYDFPHVTHENNSDTSSYIFVKNNSTMWDALLISHISSAAHIPIFAALTALISLRSAHRLGSPLQIPKSRKQAQSLTSAIQQVIFICLISTENSAAMS